MKMMDDKIADELDANIFTILFGRKKSKKSTNEVDDLSITRVSKYADFYDMNNFKRGCAIIFNHYEFSVSNFEPREGTNKDVEALENALKALHFDITICTDFTYGKTYDKIHEIAGLDHSCYDCLIIIVLTHGDNGKIYAKDAGYDPETLWTPFSGDKCPTLAGKPKIFFIQACRGKNVDPGVSLRRSIITTDSSKEVYSIPVMADLLVMYSTYEGFYSWRNPEEGSWFIQSLCEELNNSVREKDLMAILTTVNRKMAIECESYVPDNKQMDRKKQIGSIVSTLTRLLYFFPPNTIE